MTEPLLIGTCLLAMALHGGVGRTRDGTVRHSRRRLGDRRRVHDAIRSLADLRGAAGAGVAGAAPRGAAARRERCGAPSGWRSTPRSRSCCSAPTAAGRPAPGSCRRGSSFPRTRRSATPRSPSRRCATASIGCRETRGCGPRMSASLLIGRGGGARARPCAAAARPRARRRRPCCRGTRSTRGTRCGSATACRWSPRARRITAAGIGTAAGAAARARRRGGRRLGR